MLHQLHQANPPYYGYQKSSKQELYYVSDKEADLHLKGFYITLELEEKEIQYSDKGFDKVDAHFINIEISYGKFEALFSSKSRLHKHLKNSYINYF